MTCIYTDDSYRENSSFNHGGWAIAIIQPGEPGHYLAEHLTACTNNQQELIAIIEALIIIRTDEEAEILSNFQYCIKGINTWIKNWKYKKNGAVNQRLNSAVETAP